MNTMLRSLLLATAAASASASSRVPPSTGSEWMSLENGMEFQPSSAKDPQQQRALRQAQDRLLKEEQEEVYGQQISYLDTQETYYDAYAQAWRYVGFYIDCNPSEEDRRRRKLGEDESYCQRYLLWAAYVDLGYTGQGIAEYQFWDTYAEQWDASACEKVGNVNEDGTINPNTCKRMDCHHPNSNTWTLMGYFKEPEYTEWFEQLFKHEGYCVWQENEYDFMYENYGAWPEGCSETETYLSDGTLLYYDTKATANATMTYGLYTDAKCSKDYEGEEYTMEQLLQAEGGDDLLTLEYLDYWNDAMEIYRVCQPCRAYALNQGYGGNGRRQLKKKFADKYAENKRRLEDNDPNNGNWQCDDAAGYTNVNQCMKFRTKTDMYYATTEEVMEASFQGGVTTVTMDGRTYGEYRAGASVEEQEPDWPLLWGSIAFMIFGFGALGISYYYTRDKENSRKSLKQPLMNE